MNIKMFFIFVCFLFFIIISDVCAFEDNSTEIFLEETIIDEPFLNENLNDTRRDIFLNSSNIVKYYGGSERYGAYLYDDNGDFLENKTIKFLINGMEYTRVTDNVGYASVGINLSPNNYSILCIFNGDEYYKPCNRSNWVFVNSTIWGDDLVKYYHNSSQYYCLFFSVNGVALVNTNVTFNINGVFYTRTTNSTGWARLNINFNPGNYTITAINPVNGEMRANIITVLSIIVDNHDLVKYYHNNSQYVVRILGPTGSPAGAGENVTFNINGVFYTRTTNSSGHAQLNINLQPGYYIVTAYYNSYAVSNNIRVLSTLISEDFYKEYGDGSCFEVIVLDDMGNPYPNQTVNFNINGIFYNRVSDNYGIARLNINLPQGEYRITSSLNSLSISNNIHIGVFSSSKSYFLSASCSDYFYDCDNNFLYVYLSDNSGHFISNKSILLTGDNFSSARLTDNYGCAKWFIDWDVGYYNVSLSFRSNYPNDIVNNIMIDIIVLKSTSYFSNSSFVVKNDGLVQYCVKLSNQFNNPICGEIISLTLLNNTYYNVTDNNGFAYYYLNLDVGVYNVAVNFYSHSNYYSSSFFSEIFVHPDIFVDKESGFYNQSNLTVNIFSNNRDFYYSFDNISWSIAYDNVSIVLINGEWDLYGCVRFGTDA